MRPAAFRMRPGHYLRKTKGVGRMFMGRDEL
jgi:hypothetical protein